jgi:hypothetical protein
MVDLQDAVAPAAAGANQEQQRLRRAGVGELTAHDEPVRQFAREPSRAPVVGRIGGIAVVA